MTKPRDDRSLRIATVLLRKTDRWVALYAVLSGRDQEYPVSIAVDPECAVFEGGLVVILLRKDVFRNAKAASPDTKRSLRILLS